MISFGGNEVQQIFYGDTPVLRVYNGPNLVWEAGSGAVVERAAVRSASSAMVAYNTTAKRIAKPDGTAEGDLLVIFMYADYGAAGSLQPPSGFTTLQSVDVGANNIKFLAAFKVAGNSEPLNYTMSVGTDADLRADMVCVRNADTSKTPDSSITTTASSATSHTLMGLNAQSAPGVLIGGIAKSRSGLGGAVWTPPAGMTKVSGGVTNNYVTMTAAAQDLEQAGATGQKTFTISQTVAGSAARGALVFVPSLPGAV